MLPEQIAPFIMPFLNIVLFFALEMLINLVIRVAKKEKTMVVAAVPSGVKKK